MPARWPVTSLDWQENLGKGSEWVMVLCPWARHLTLFFFFFFFYFSDPPSKSYWKLCELPHFLLLESIYKSHHLRSQQSNWQCETCVCVPAVLGRSTSSATCLCLSREPTIPPSFCCAARWSAVLPWRSVRVASAPANSRASAASLCCVMTARCKGVWLRERKPHDIREEEVKQASS